MDGLGKRYVVLSFIRIEWLSGQLQVPDWNGDGSGVHYTCPSKIRELWSLFGPDNAPIGTHLSSVHTPSLLSRPYFTSSTLHSSCSIRQHCSYKQFVGFFVRVRLWTLFIRLPSAQVYPKQAKRLLNNPLVGLFVPSIVCGPALGDSYMEIQSFGCPRY
jgi:hypothetical protein